MFSLFRKAGFFAYGPPLYEQGQPMNEQRPPVKAMATNARATAAEE